MGSYLYYYFFGKEETNDLFKYEKYNNSYFLSSPYSSINFNSSFLINLSKEDFTINYNQIDILERNLNSKIVLLSHKQLKNKRVLKTSKIINEQYYNDYIKEINALKYLDHPNIIKIYEYQIIQKKTVDILIEFLKGPTLFSKLSQIKHFKEKETLIIMHQLFSCIKMTHDNGITHRDIKPENIIIIDEKNLYIKLIDYGSCEIFSEQNKETNRRLGTPSYVSPEIIKGDNYSYECDIWALGILMYFLLSGKVPFDGITQNEIFYSITNKKISFEEEVWKDISLDAKNLIKCLLIKDKNKRININQILDTPWIINGLKLYNIKNNLHSKDFCINVIKINLMKFYEANINQLQLLFLFYIIHNYTDLNNEILLLKNEFVYYDEDNDGKLSKNELNNLLIDLDINEDVREKILNTIFEIFGENRGKYIFYESFLVIGLSNKKKYCNNEGIIKKFFELITKRKFDNYNINDNIIKAHDLNNLLFVNNEDKFRKEESLSLLENIGINEENNLNYETFKNSLFGFKI